MNGNIDNRKRGEATGNGIASSLEWFFSGQTLMMFWPKAVHVGPTCVDASMKSMNFSVNWPRFSYMLIDLTSKAVQVDLKCEHFRVNWPQSERTLIDLQLEAGQSAIKSTHVDQNRLQAVPTLIEVVPKGVPVSTERKTSWQKESASSQKAIKVAAKADRSSQGLTDFRMGCTHGWLKATQPDQDWPDFLQMQSKEHRIPTAAAVEVVNAARIDIQSPMPPDSPGTRPINPNHRVITFLFMP